MRTIDDCGPPTWSPSSGRSLPSLRCRSAAIPRLLRPEQLPAANSLSMTVQQVGAIAGPVLAGALIPVVGLPTLYLSDAIALLATVWAVWRLPELPPTGSARKAGFR